MRFHSTYPFLILYLKKLIVPKDNYNFYRPEDNYNFNKANFSAMNTHFANLNWTQICHSCNHSFNDTYLKFISIVHNAFLLFVPLKESTPNHIHFPPHIIRTYEYLKILGRYLSKPHIRTKFIKSSRKLKCIIARHYRKNEDKIYKKSKSNYLKFIAKKQNHMILSQFYPTLMVTNYLLHEQKATEFCNQFLSVYNSASSTAPILPSTQPPIDPLFDYNLMFIPDHLVHSDLDKSKPKLNKSPDGIPSLVLKKCEVSLAKPISHILRMSFMLGKVPNL